MEVLLRNYITSCIARAPQGPERTELFKWFCDAWKSPEKKEILIKRQTETPPFDKNRYEFVMKQAYQLSQNTSEITKKTRFCTKGKCSNEKCGFAHSKEEWNPPYCLYQEFCKMPECTKNHGFTKEEYMSLHDIVHEKSLTLVNTQFCQIMKEERPCNVSGCKFCHSMWDYTPIKCPFYNTCNNPKCVKKHEWDTIFSYMEKQGVQLKLWYLRTSDLNNSIQWKNLGDQSVVEAKLLVEAYTEEIKKLEANGWKETDVTILFEKLSVKKDVDVDVDVDEDEDEMDVEITIAGKKSFSLSEFLRQQYIDEMKFEDDDVDDDSLLQHDEEELMLVANQLDLDFETVYDLIIDGKQHLIYKWQENYKSCF